MIEAKSYTAIIGGFRAHIDGLDERTTIDWVRKHFPNFKLVKIEKNWTVGWGRVSYKLQVAGLDGIVCDWVVNFENKSFEDVVEEAANA